MANTTPSTYMLLPVPTVGVDTGPDWASNLNSCLQIIDQHSHSAGSGVQINPAGININSDLPFLGNNAVALRTTRWNSQSAVLTLPTDLGCAYVVSGDLYFNDGSGNNVRITQSGAVAGTPGSIANLASPASASYVSASSTFVWQSAANTPANMDLGGLVLRNIAASSKGLTLNPPAAMGANYTITLPALPSVQNIMTLDASGNMSAPWNVDNATLAIVSSNLQIKNLGVGTGQIAAGAVTKPKAGPAGQQISSGSGSFTTSSTSYVDVTNLSVTITTYGNPVSLSLQSSGAVASVGANSTGGSTANAELFLAFLRAGSIIASYDRSQSAAGTSSAQFVDPPGLYNFLDPIAAGTYTYSVQVKAAAGSLVSVTSIVLVAREIS